MSKYIMFGSEQELKKQLSEDLATYNEDVLIDLYEYLAPNLLKPDAWATLPFRVVRRFDYAAVPYTRVPYYKVRRRVIEESKPHINVHPDYADDCLWYDNPGEFYQVDGVQWIPRPDQPAPPPEACRSVPWVSVQGVNGSHVLPRPVDKVPDGVTSIMLEVSNHAYTDPVQITLRTDEDRQQYIHWLDHLHDHYIHRRLKEVQQKVKGDKQ